jgi:peptidoglycan/LPS O-acetylase OafA/YrhL
MLIISIIAYASPIIMPDTLDSFFISIGSTIFLLWIYFNQESFIVSFLELKPIAFLGKISYGVYIYQGLFLTICPCGNLPIQKFPLNLFLTFIVAIISYIFLEKKIMRYKHFNL